MTHADLVKRAVKWLKTTKRCSLVFAEHYMFNEVPDALGYRRAYSLCVECKVSRSDFLRDRKKRSRRSYADRPALLCWYLTPRDLLFGRNADDERVLFRELPDGWGLLEVDEQGRVTEAVAPRLADTWQDDRTPAQFRTELERLYCEIRRYHAQGLHYEPVRTLQERERAERRERATASIESSQPRGASTV